MQVSACQSQVFEPALGIKNESVRARQIFVYMIDVPPQVNDIRLGFEDAGVAPMPPRFRNIHDETVKALAFLPSDNHLLGCDDRCVVVCSVKHERPYKRHVTEWRNLPGVVHRGLHVVLPHARWNNGLFTPKRPLPFAPRRCGRMYCPPSFSSSCSCLAHAVVFSMLPVFLA